MVKPLSEHPGADAAHDSHARANQETQLGAERQVTEAMKHAGAQALVAGGVNAVHPVGNVLHDYDWTPAEAAEAVLGAALPLSPMSQRVEELEAENTRLDTELRRIQYRLERPDEDVGGPSALEIANRARGRDSGYPVRALLKDGER